MCCQNVNRLFSMRQSRAEVLWTLKILRMDAGKSRRPKSVKAARLLSTVLYIPYPTANYFLQPLSLFAKYSWPPI